MESFVQSYQLSVEEFEPKLAPISSEFQTLVNVPFPKKI